MISGKLFRKVVFLEMVLVCVFFFSGAVSGICQQKLAQGKKGLFLDFENIPIGSLPEGWKVEATRKYGPLATWQVVKDNTAPSGEKVLALTKINHGSGSTFNLCWTNDVSFQDGTIEVMLKPVSGRIDQGGGIMWRVKDRNNYYVARFNPLEDNFRVYYVANGHRMMMNSARVSLPAGKWHSMKIVQKGDRYQCYLNGKKYLEGTDDHFQKAGGVGLWTKADAVTSFDNFKVEAEN